MLDSCRFTSNFHPQEIKSSLAIHKYINHFGEGESSSGPIFLLCFWFILIPFCYFFTTPSIFSVSKRSITASPQLLETLFEPLSSVTYSICCIHELHQDPPSPLWVLIFVWHPSVFESSQGRENLYLWCVQHVLSFKRFCGSFSNPVRNSWFAFTVPLLPLKAPCGLGGAAPPCSGHSASEDKGQNRPPSSWEGSSENSEQTQDTSLVFQSIAFANTLSDFSCFKMQLGIGLTIF